MLKYFLDFLYPRRCPVCDDIVFPKGKLACPACRRLLKPLQGSVCFKCGRQISAGDKEFCSTCLQFKRSFDKAYSLWEYDSLMKSSISKFKYKGRREFADFYSDELLKHFEPLLLSLNLSAIIPVPIHKDKLSKRGFNQAELLSHSLSERLNIREITDYLIRSKSTVAQKELDFAKRRKNLAGAFEVNKSSPYYDYYIENVLLVDDIYTTGSTSDACAQVLKASGTDKVYVLCLASVSDN